MKVYVRRVEQTLEFLDLYVRSFSGGHYNASTDVKEVVCSFFYMSLISGKDLSLHRIQDEKVVSRTFWEF